MLIRVPTRVLFLFSFVFVLVTIVLSSQQGLIAQERRHRNTSPRTRVGGRTDARSPRKSTSVHLRAVGDILLAGPMAKVLRKQGRDYPFAQMRDVLREADLTFGNLECCLSRRGRPIPKQFNFRGDPDDAQALKSNGFGIVSMANNHSWDYGRDALLDTQQCVRALGVETVGAGANREEAHRLVVVERKGLRIGFLAYLGLIPALVAESATEPSVSMASVSVIRREVAEARKRVDVLIVSLHAGQEGAPKPTPRQRSFAEAAINGGADLVIGHHPHVRQPLIYYHGKPICYSLGNFVFSTAGRGSGAMLDATLSRHHVVARLVPLVLDGPQPRLAE